MLTPSRPSAGESGPATTSARASSSWNPVFNGGFVWRLSRRFGITASASYLPLKTTAEIDTLTASGSPIIVIKTRVSLDRWSPPADGRLPLLVTLLGMLPDRRTRANSGPG